MQVLQARGMSQWRVCGGVKHAVSRVMRMEDVAKGVKTIAPKEGICTFLVLKSKVRALSGRGFWSSCPQM